MADPFTTRARGNRRERIFRNEADRLLFYQTLGEACERTGWRGHAWGLMSNHYHLMGETPQTNLGGGNGRLQNTYTRRHNCRHRLWGRLFGDRYNARRSSLPAALKKYLQSVKIC